MSKINDAAAVTDRPYGGYALTRVKRAGGDETPRFEATLVHDRRPIAFVSNGGEGGAHRIQPVDAGGWADLEAFNAYAAGWNAQSPLAGIADGDQLVNRLVMVDRLNRARALPFLLDNEDFWADGEHSAFRGATAAQTLEALRSVEFAHRRPRVWSRTVGDFVSVS
ncbi:MAG: hypothetical protein ACOH17_04270 [Cellulomonas sp.]